MEHLNPQTIRFAFNVLTRAVMLGVTVLGMRAAGGFFDPSNPRGAFAFVVVLVVSTTVLAGILLVIRQ